MKARNICIGTLFAGESDYDVIETRQSDVDNENKKNMFNDIYNDNNDEENIKLFNSGEIMESKEMNQTEKTNKEIQMIKNNTLLKLLPNCNDEKTAD